MTLAPRSSGEDTHAPSPSVEGGPLLVAGAVAVLVNGTSALMLLRAGNRTPDRSDPLIWMEIGVPVVWATWRLLRETVHVLLEGIPRGLEDATRFLAQQEGLDELHHVHLWDLASDVPAAEQLGHADDRMNSLPVS